MDEGCYVFVVSTGREPIERVLVAMSGGVDSAVVAGLLKRDGYDVVGVTLHLWDAPPEERIGRCCAPEDRQDARRVCDVLEIPHYVIDEREAFRAEVVEPYMEGLLQGLTPLPCATCNSFVKLDRLLAIADMYGAELIATGHYARLSPAVPGGVPRVGSGQDTKKDQSYFLFGLSEALRRRLLFPLGETSKTAARQLAEELGLPIAHKRDSQELCFVPTGDVAGFMRREGRPLASGRIVSESGETLALHDGSQSFTAGQRRGLGLGALSPASPATEQPASAQLQRSEVKPRFVLRTLADGDVVVGEEARLMSETLSVAKAVWQSDTPETFEARIKIRHGHMPAPATITRSGSGFRARFSQAQRAITPGQGAVIYDAEGFVLGGGFVARESLSPEAISV